MKIAKLYIKGMREPLDLTEEQGKKAQRIIDNEGDIDYRHLRDSDTVTIGEVFTGGKGDLRYVRFEVVQGEKEEVAYDEYELIEIQKELEPYFLKKGDDEYELEVKKLIKNIKQEEKPFWTKKTIKLILKVIEKKLTDDSLIKEEAEKIAAERFVGRLFAEGEKRFLISKKAIKVDGKGNITTLNFEGEMPSISLGEKLTAYKEHIAKKEYAVSESVKYYDEVVQSMPEIDDYAE